MKNKRMTWREMCDTMERFNEEHGYTRKGNDKHITGVVVFTEDSFDKPYSEESRSYEFTSDNKYFLSDQIGNSIFADCLDGTDSGVRLDWYLGDWKVKYCYLR